MKTTNSGSGLAPPAEDMVVFAAHLPATAFQGEHLEDISGCLCSEFDADVARTR